MKWTNKYNLPQTIVNAIAGGSRPHRPNTLSASQFAKPVQALVLTHRHDDEIEMDVSDGLWALMGRAIHYVLEGGGGMEHLVEEGLSMPCGEWTITGRPDLLHMVNGGYELQDYKMTSVWSFINTEKMEWEKQLNVYALLFGHSGFHINNIVIQAMLKDWNRRKFAMDRSGKYPPIPFQTKDVPVWDHETQLTFVMSHMKKYQDALLADDDSLPECTPEEQWASQTIYAVMKKGRKSSMANLHSYAEAEKWIANKVKEKILPLVSIEVRPGEKRNCNEYCIPRAFCKQKQREAVLTTPDEDNQDEQEDIDE